MAFILEGSDVAGAGAAAARDHVDVHGGVAEVVIEILGPKAYVLPKRLLDAAAHGIADLGAVVTARELQDIAGLRAEEVYRIVDAAVSETAGTINQGAVPGIAETAAQRPQILELLVENVVAGGPGKAVPVVTAFTLSLKSVY